MRFSTYKNFLVLVTVLASFNTKAVENSNSSLTGKGCLLDSSCQCNSNGN